MLRLLIAASCLVAVCYAQAGGTLQAMCTMNVMQGGVNDRLSDTMGTAARTMIQPTMAGNPMALNTLSGASPAWKCLVDSSAVINPMTRQIDVGATAGTISDYFDTVVELKRFIPFFNPCTTVFCGEKGMNPLTIANEVVRSMTMRMPMANAHAKFFGTQANQLPFGTASNPKSPMGPRGGMPGGMPGMPRMPGMTGMSGMPGMMGMRPTARPAGGAMPNPFAALAGPTARPAGGAMPNPFAALAGAGGNPFMNMMNMMQNMNRPKAPVANTGATAAAGAAPNTGAAANAGTPTYTAPNTNFNLGAGGMPNFANLMRMMQG